MAISEELLKPITPENPSGIRLRGLPVVDILAEARKSEDSELMRATKEGDPSKAKKADWVLVRELSEKTLATQSKDLQVAAWWVESLVYLEQIPGLTSGLTLFRELLETFWDSLYPPLDNDGSPEARVGPITWLGNYYNPSKSSSPAYALLTVKDDWLSFDKQTARQRSGSKPSKQEFFQNRLDSWDRCSEALRDLEAFCNKERFGTDLPSFEALRKELDAIGESIRAKLSTEPPAASEGGKRSSIANSPRSADGLLTNSPALSLNGEITDKNTAHAYVTAAARFLQTRDPEDPIPYLLLRALRWGELRATTNEHLYELLEAPPVELRIDIKRLAQGESWQELLDLSETAMCSGYGRGWLDLQRYVVKACEGLGYETAAKAVRSELRTLLADITDLHEKTLLDDTGTANPETITWLKKENLLR